MAKAPHNYINNAQQQPVEGEQVSDAAENVDQLTNQTSDEIIRITIDLGNNQPAESIIVFRGEENKSDELARKFCEKHDFDEKIQAALAQQIQRNIDQVMAQMLETSENNSRTATDPNEGKDSKGRARHAETESTMRVNSKKASGALQKACVEEAPNSNLDCQKNLKNKFQNLQKFENLNQIDNFVDQP